MKIYIFLITIIFTLLDANPVSNITKQTADNLFITNLEYGQMLYKNPRGIGCVKCHGKKGEGKFIARYTHKEKKFEINAPAINNISLQQFTKVLKAKSSTTSIMPSYFLTDDEMKQIHFYITHKDTK